MKTYKPLTDELHWQIGSSYHIIQRLLAKKKTSDSLIDINIYNSKNILEYESISDERLVSFLKFQMKLINDIIRGDIPNKGIIDKHLKESEYIIYNFIEYLG